MRAFVLCLLLVLPAQAHARDVRTDTITMAGHAEETVPRRAAADAPARPADTPTRASDTAPVTDTDLAGATRASLEEILEAYRREDLSSILRRIDEGFEGATSRPGIRVTRATLPDSLRCDFEILGEIFLDMTVDAVRIHRARREVQVEAVWSFRARLAPSGQEVVERRRRTHLLFRVERGRAFLLRQDFEGLSDGAALLARSDPLRCVLSIRADAGSQVAPGEVHVRGASAPGGAGIE